MTDLDARVAALEMALQYISWHAFGECRVGHGPIPEAIDVADAIRAELQKPALHEAVSDQETIDAIRSHCLKVTTESMIDMRRTLESFLQGRAEPAQEEITDGECYRWLLANDGANACHPAIQSMWANCKTNYPSQQEWDVAIRAAIRASKGVKT